MVFAETSGLTKLYEMVEYCENQRQCRKVLMSMSWGFALLASGASRVDSHPSFAFCPPLPPLHLSFAAVMVV